MTPSAPASGLYAQHVTTIDGRDTTLADYRGKALLIVNTASQCGYTPQYEGLQALYEAYRDKGLVVLGFPSNDFGGQEPGSEAEIQSFVKDKYGVTFPMFSKVTVKGDGKVPLYEALIASDAGGGKAIGWNFTKFVVDRHGHVVARFDSSVTPQSPELVQAIQRALGK